jgi:Domain of unknown function (DUF2017)
VPRRQIQRARDGSYRLRLSPTERELLRALTGELEQLLDTPENPDLWRLFPIVSEDAETHEEYSRLVGNELLDGRRRALATIRETAGRDRLTAEEAESWLTGLNALRLLLGTRLDVSEDEPLDLDPSDARAHETAVYLYLSWLQEQLVDAMARAL